MNRHFKHLILQYKHIFYLRFEINLGIYQIVKQVQKITLNYNSSISTHSVGPIEKQGFNGVEMYIIYKNYPVLNVIN